jgi:DNA-directed RNA polymerase specialized sigma24 family protein
MSRGVVTVDITNAEGGPAPDVDLCARLRASGCQGKEWEVFAAAIYTKAVRTTYRWITEDGFIFQRCHERRRGVASGDLSEWSTADIRALAHETVVASFDLFKRVGILGGGWDPSKGASLFTYFMNGVILCFPNVFRRVNKERTRWQYRVELHNDLKYLKGIDELAVNDFDAAPADLVSDLLGAIRSPDQRRVAELYFIYSRSTTQIAEQLRKTEASVRSLLNRARHAMRREYQRGKEEGHDQ